MRDSELLRRLLLPAEGPLSRWTLLGQSFGGFCCVTYLSFAPKGAISCCRAVGLPLAALLAAPSFVPYSFEVISFQHKLLVAGSIKR